MYGGIIPLLSEQHDREDARTAVSDQQMRSTPRYPVDRYLVESSNKIEMVNIIDDEIWNTDPALRPEDEVILRRLHDMLQSTADDLKLLSGDLAKFRQPGVQIKTQPIPIDEEFNDQVHIEELVNAKFHGYKMVDKTALLHTEPTLFVNSKASYDNTRVQVEAIKKPLFKNLTVTQTRTLDIDEKIDKVTKQKHNNRPVLNVIPAPAVAYNEFTYKYEESKNKPLLTKFKIQDMPSVNIRSELKEQKVLQLDIFPDSKLNTESTADKSNVVVVAVEHKSEISKQDSKISLTNKYRIRPITPATQLITTGNHSQSNTSKQPVRKVSKMSTCESSESANNISSDTLHNIKTQKQIKSVIRFSPKGSARDRSKTKKVYVSGKEPDRRTRLNIEDWKKKLYVVYGQPSTSRNNKPMSKQIKKQSAKKSNLSATSIKPLKPSLQNAEYIPYSQLTLGGVRVSDIEREISDIPNKNEIALSPILDKILGSRENSFYKDSPRRGKNNKSPRLFTTSDENLLQEVIDIERKVSKTIENNKEKKSEEKLLSESSESKEDDAKVSYADDFEEDNSNSTENSRRIRNQSQSEIESNKSDSFNNNDEVKSYSKSGLNKNSSKAENTTYTKKSNLSIKNSVEIFEFVHSVDTQDTATQSNTTHKISLKETQTSPRNDKISLQPIHNDLWPVDPKCELEKIFKLEKDFIKKLIIDEYGEYLEKNINKPSTSKTTVEERQRNIAASQKVTQTSPAHVKSVMTSPTKTKTRTTSPFLSVKVDHQTSPMIVVTNEEHLTVELDNDEEGISVNLSSPRFNLRLPQTSREVLSNLESSGVSPSEDRVGNKNDNTVKVCKTHIKSSSSSSEVENSSEMSSLGEVNIKLKRRLKNKETSISESSESSFLSKGSSDLLTGSILPLRSEGEISFGQLMKKVSNKVGKNSKSEGETSLKNPK